MTKTENGKKDILSENKSSFRDFKNANFLLLLKNSSALMLGILMSLLIGIGIIAFTVIIYEVNKEPITAYLKQLIVKDFSLLIVSWIILLIISFMAFYQIKEIIKS